MEYKPKCNIILILLVTVITTSITWKYFCELFFFFGFFNPVIFIGTSPSLLLKKNIYKDKKNLITYSWLIISVLIIVVTSMFMFKKGSYV